MSAFGYKRTFWGPLISVRFTPESRPISGSPFMSVPDPKRTFTIARFIRYADANKVQSNHIPCQYQAGAPIAAIAAYLIVHLLKLLTEPA